MSIRFNGRLEDAKFTQIPAYRSSSRKGSVEKVFFKLFQNSHESTCARVSKAAGLQSATLLRRTLQHRYFPANVDKFLRRPIS